MSLIIEIVTTIERGMAVKMEPFVCPSPGTACKMTRKRK